MITIISTGRKYNEPQASDMHLDARKWPCPAPELRQLDGRHAAVQTAVLTPDPAVLKRLTQAAGFAAILAQDQDQVTVVIECNEGIHRSVAGAECLHALIRDAGGESTVFHRDLGRRAS